MGEQRPAREIEVADAVERLVADELVLETKAVRVHNPVVGQHDGVLQRPAKDKAAAPQLSDIPQEAVRARPAHVALINAVNELEVTPLAPDRRVVAGDLEAHREAVRRRQRDRAFAVRHLDRLQHLNGLARRRLLDDPGTLDKKHKRSRAAVHDRHLGPVELDHDVVDAETRERRHQVLDRRHPIAVAVAETGAHIGGADVLIARRQLRSTEVGAPKHDARPRLGGMQDHPHLIAAVQADARALDRAAERFLSNHTRGNGFTSPLGYAGSGPAVLLPPPRHERKRCVPTF